MRIIYVEWSGTNILIFYLDNMNCSKEQSNLFLEWVSLNLHHMQIVQEYYEVVCFVSPSYIKCIHKTIQKGFPIPLSDAITAEKDYLIINGNWTFFPTPNLDQNFEINSPEGA